MWAVRSGDRSSHAFAGVTLQACTVTSHPSISAPLLCEQSLSFAFPLLATADPDGRSSSIGVLTASIISTVISSQHETAISRTIQYSKL